MKKIIKILILLEIQVALVLIILAFSKQSVLEQKIYNTNKFVYELLLDKRMEELKEIDKYDIVIGEYNAPATLYIYSRYGCNACGKFFENVYPKLQEEYIYSGELKIVIRQMVQTSKPDILHASLAAMFAYEEEWFEEFNNSMHSLDATPSNEIVDNMITQLIGCNIEEYDAFMTDGSNMQTLLNKADNVRKAGIKGTPTFVIGDEIMVGTRPFKKFQALIEDELLTESCEQ